MLLYIIQVGRYLNNFFFISVFSSEIWQDSIQELEETLHAFCNGCKKWSDPLVHIDVKTCHVKKCTGQQNKRRYSGALSSSDLLLQYMAQHLCINLLKKTFQPAAIAFTQAGTKLFILLLVPQKRRDWEIVVITHSVLGQ